MLVQSGMPSNSSHLSNDFCSNMFNNFTREDFKPHSGKETSLAEFKKEGGAQHMCSHLPQSIKSSDGDWEIYYHITDTPGYEQPLMHQVAGLQS